MNSGCRILIALWSILHITGCSTPIPYRNDPVIGTLRQSMTKPEALQAVQDSLKEARQGKGNLYDKEKVRVDSNAFTLTKSVSVPYHPIEMPNTLAKSGTMKGYLYNRWELMDFSFHFTNICYVALYDSRAV